MPPRDAITESIMSAIELRIQRRAGRDLVDDELPRLRLARKNEVTTLASTSSWKMERTPK